VDSRAPGRLLEVGAVASRRGLARHLSAGGAARRCRQAQGARSTAGRIAPGDNFVIQFRS
jgi:hypothetical protein